MLFNVVTSVVVVVLGLHALQQTINGHWACPPIMGLAGLCRDKTTQQAAAESLDVTRDIVTPVMPLVTTNNNLQRIIAHANGVIVELEVAGFVGEQDTLLARFGLRAGPKSIGSDLEDAVRLAAEGAAGVTTFTHDFVNRLQSAAAAAAEVAANLRIIRAHVECTLLQLECTLSDLQRAELEQTVQRGNALVLQHLQQLPMPSSGETYGLVGAAGKFRQAGGLMRGVLTQLGRADARLDEYYQRHEARRGRLAALLTTLGTAVDQLHQMELMTGEIFSSDNYLQYHQTAEVLAGQAVTRTALDAYLEVWTQLETQLLFDACFVRHAVAGTAIDYNPRCNQFRTQLRLQ